jgi:hypothetical protein
MWISFQQKPDGERRLELEVDRSVDKAVARLFRLPVILVMVAIISAIWLLTGHWIPAIG